MERINKLNELSNYYRDKGLTIIGLNDSQGVNVTSTFFKKGLLEYISAALKNEDLKPLVINAFSLTMNKTEHIDYFLESNLSLEEIKLSQIYSVVSALEKVMSDIKAPKVLGQIGNLFRVVYAPKNGDEKVFITDSLKNNDEPTLIYSSGVNNLMREVGNNPFAIKKDYENRDITPNYGYTISKANNPLVLQSVINGIERNFENILSVNHKTDIYTLGAYVPKSLEKEGMNVFRDLISNYNEKLESLCKQYNIVFINTELIGKMYNKSNVNFHVTTQGHNALADYILNSMYEKKVEGKYSKSKNNKSLIPTIYSHDVSNIYERIMKDYRESLSKADREIDDYAMRRMIKIAEEHERERVIFEKIKKRNKK